MEERSIWHQDDEFWREMAPFMFTEEAWDAAPEQVSQALDLMGIEDSARFLDLACGPGRHSLELARRGFQVTGVDRTTEYLDEAHKRADREELDIEFVNEDMRHFSRPNAYDGAWSMFTSFGYFEQPSDNQQVLDNTFRSLKDGGVFLIELMGREVLARIFQARDWREVDGSIVLYDRHVERNWTIMRNNQIFIKDDRRLEFTITHWLYSGAELAGMLEESGFKSVELYGNLEGSPYDQTAKRLVAVARK
jgi:ubiquinone/menaquinone biosynthesis C-methylase UbiE